MDGTGASPQTSRNKIVKGLCDLEVVEGWGSVCDLACGQVVQGGKRVELVIGSLKLLMVN